MLSPDPTDCELNKVGKFPCIGDCARCPQRIEVEVMTLTDDDLDESDLEFLESLEVEDEDSDEGEEDFDSEDGFIVEELEDYLRRTGQR